MSRDHLHSIHGIFDRLANHARSDLNQVDMTSIWVDELTMLIDDHPRRFYARGNVLANLIRNLEYNSEEQILVATLSGRLANPMLEIGDSPVDPNLALDVNCNCGRTNDMGMCEHTYALCKYLLGLFHAKKPDPFVTALLGKAVPDWEVALQDLDRVIKVTTERAKTTRVVKPMSRLVWRVTTENSYSYRGPISLNPVEQTPRQTKGGGWNKGRIISWNKVVSQADFEVTPADLAIVKAAGVTMYCDTPYGDGLCAAFEALIGHSNVVMGADPVQVLRGELGLFLSEQKSSWRLLPMLNGIPVVDYSFCCRLGTDCVLAHDQKRMELVVARDRPELVAYAVKLMERETLIPPEAQPEFVKRLPLLEAAIPVALPASMKGELVPASEQLTLQIHPTTTSGVRINLRVTPAPEGMSYVPGEGADEVFGKHDGVRVRVQRDRATETRLAKQLGEELFLNRFSQLGSFGWGIEKDDDLLDLLDALRARPDGNPLVVWSDDAAERQLTVLGEVSPSSLKVEIKDQHDWFGLSGTIELQGQKFPLATLLTALRDGHRYISLGKGQFASIAQEFRDRLASVSDMLHNNRGKLEFNSTAAPLIADLLDDETTLKVSKKWKTALERLNRATDLDPQVPNTLTADLRDYQVEGFQWLCRLAEWGVGGILADDMGLGKTVQALATLLVRRDVGPILVVAPVSVGFNWQRETERFTPTLNPILYRDSDRDDVLNSLGPGDMLITSYHLLQQHAEQLSAVTWGTLVLDEAQCIKNSQTKTAQVVRGLNADWRLALTGTPCENHLGDLWSIFRGVSPGLFGSWERFREVFADPIEKGKVAERRQALSRVLRPFVLRRTKSEVLKELPARTEISLMAELSDSERQRYEDARLWAVTHLTGLEMETGKDQRFQVLAALTRLRQLACHPRLVDQTWDKSSAKLDLFLETIEELRDGKHRALVFSQFTSHLALIREALDARQIQYQYLDGQTPPKKRRERVDAFQRGEGEFFLISLKAGGTGLNLTGADYVIHLDPWWNPAVEDQATDRAHRIGQTRPVTVYRLVARDTIEEQILKLHAEKRHLVAGILEGTDQAAKLSTSELVDLIKLGGRQT